MNDAAINALRIFALDCEATKFADICSLALAGNRKAEKKVATVLAKVVQAMRDGARPYVVEIVTYRAIQEAM